MIAVKPLKAEYVSFFRSAPLALKLDNTCLIFSWDHGTAQRITLAINIFITQLLK